jgi:molecular chaperone Hsp33
VAFSGKQALAGLALPPDDLILPFQVAALDVRGRLIRLGAAANQVISRQAYPAPVAGLLGEAVALTCLLGASLKFDGKFIFQTRTDGPVHFMVVDYATAGNVRGLAHFHEDQVAALEQAGNITARDLLGAGHLAMTIDRGVDTDRYQGVVALEGQSLSEAAQVYFRQSEQIPTVVKLAAGPIVGQVGEDWRAGGIVVQHLPRGGARQPDFDPGDAPPGAEPADVAPADDDWVKASLLLNTVEDHELLDPTLAPERLLYRLYHEDGVKVFDPQAIAWHCHCSRSRILEMLQQFSGEDRAHMVENGVVKVTCEFCASNYRFDPAEIEAS